MKGGRLLAPRLRACMALSVSTLALAGCFFETRSALEGPGSETVGLHGEAGFANGLAAVQAKVTARPSAYFQDTAELAPHAVPGGQTQTDAHGEYIFASLAPEEYSLEIRGDSGRAALVHGSVIAGKSTEAVKAILKPVGGIKGKVARLRPSMASVFIQIAGMDRLQYVAPDSSLFIFPDLPEGRYTLRVMSPDPVLDTVILEDIDVLSGQVRDVGEVLLDAFAREDYARWTHARSIVIRAGKAGADIAGGVMGFPLLIRLDSANFPFDSTASPTGADIRFATPSGKRLPYEIESWDAAGRRALIWVKADTIRGGDDTQGIRMLWGNRAATDLSSGPGVFAPGDGYRGVWHMRRGPGGGPAFPDATPLGNGLVTDVPEAVNAFQSPLAMSALMDGKQGLLSSTIPGDAPQTFTVSLWFRATGPGKLIGFESGYLSRNTTAYDRHLWLEPDGSVHFGIYIADPPEGSSAFERTLVSPPGLIDSAWHLVVGSQSPETGQELFVDGKKVAGNPAVTHAETLAGYWILGGGALAAWSPTLSGSHFQGALDEVRVKHSLLSADWIKLSFENQKAGSTVLEFREP